MKIRVYTMVFLVCFAVFSFSEMPCHSVEGQTDWTRYSGNPVLVNGALFEWDMAIMHPSVVEEPMIGYKMFFTAQNLTATFEPRLRIGLASAPDEVTWSKNPSNPVMDVGSPGSWEEIGVATPWVVLDMTGYRMWYTGLDSSMFPQIGYAMSSDGESWTKHPSNPILTPGATDDWDGNGTMAPSVLFIGGIFHAWYTGADLDGMPRIGYATSGDGISWTKYQNNPVLDAGAPGEWDSGGVAMPSVLFDGVKYRMWFAGSLVSGFPDVGYAVSHDGINWTKHYENPVLSKGSPGEWDEMMIAGTSVLQKSGEYHMWFGGTDWMGGSGIAYANSTAVPNRLPVLSGGSVSPDLGMANDTFRYRVTYQDEDNDPPSLVRVWVNKSGTPVGTSPYEVNFEKWIGNQDNWSAGAGFAFSIDLSAEGPDYTFAFEASDGEEAVFTPEENGPIVSTAVDPPDLIGASLSGIGFQEVRLDWWASSNDTGLGGDVQRYDIYHGSLFSLTGDGYSILTSLPAVGVPSYSYEHIGGGEGDPSNYFYMICAVNALNATSCTENQAGKFTRHLLEGPNLVSVPLMQPNESIEIVLQTVKWDKAWNYDSSLRKWKSFATFKPYEGALGTIDNAMGIWVNVTGDMNLTVAGLIPERTSIQLRVGWNLIGFPSFNSTFTVSDLKAAVNSSRVEGFDPSSSPYYLKILDDTEVLQAGQGYWVWVDTGIVLLVDT